MIRFLKNSLMFGNQERKTETVLTYLLSVSASVQLTAYSLFAAITHIEQPLDLINRLISSNFFSRSMACMDSDSNAECSIGIHQFKEKLLETTVHFQVLKMSNSFHVWCGNSPQLSNMAVAMKTKYDTSMPNGCQLMKENTDSLTVPIAQKLAKKTGKQVFVSSNLTTDSLMAMSVEQRIFEELKLHPEKF